MKKEFSKAVSLMLSLALAVGMTAGGATEAKSAPKLSPKKLSVEVGKKKMLKVKNSKKKAIWTIKSGKKYVSLSSKKKASVVIKGKKAGKASVQAKVGSKKLICKLTVTKKLGGKVTPTKKPTATAQPTLVATMTAAVTTTPTATATPTPTTTATPTPTATATPEPTATPIPTPTPKVDIVPGKNEKVIESETHVVPITELNETTLTSNSKRPSDSDEVAGYTSFDKKGVTFTSLKQCNSGVSFYVNPCTSDNDLVELSRGEEYLGFRNAVKDMSDYDYIRIELTCENEVNLRTYDGYDTLENESFPGCCSTETYEHHWIGPVPCSEYMEEAEGLSSLKIKPEYTTRTLFVPIADLYDGKDSGAGSGCDLFNISAVAISPQEEGFECTIHSIDFVKVERTNKVSEIKITCEKDAVANNKTAELIAIVGPENATRKIVRWTSKDETLATVDFQGTVFANNKGRAGNCTFVAEATDGSGVKGEITLQIGDSSLEVAKVET